MEYKNDGQPSLKNGQGDKQPANLWHAIAPATLLPTVLSRLGLANRPLVGDNRVVAALQDKKSSVRVAAIRSLEGRGEASSLPLLVSALHDPAWEVRVAAVWALSAFGEYSPVEALIEALDDEDGSVRASALRVLAELRGQIPPETLASMLHDADWLVHEAATSTVEELEEQAPTQRLGVGLPDENAVEREAVQMPHRQLHPDRQPSLPFTWQRAGRSDMIGERYRLQDPLGRGGMATIYRGRDMRLNRVVAIKVLHEVYNTDAKFVARFQREAKAASALKHPNIVQVYDYGQTEGNYYIVMELVEGTDLRRYLRSRGVLDVNRSVIIAHDVALGLAAAHRRGIVHRDVKPQNILVGRDGSIKLTDFGIVSVYQDIHAKRLTTTGMTLGTVEYYAPEQALGEIVSPAADVYELGIVLYELLTGHTPFEGDTPVTVAMQHIQDPPLPPSQFNPTIPAALEEIILRCLEKVPEMRFRDGSSLARALEKLGDAQLSEAASTAPGQLPVFATSHTIPSRPANSGRGSTRENVPPDAPATSLDTKEGPGVPPYSNDAGHVPGFLVNQPLYANQQSFAPPGTDVFSQFQPGSIPSSGVVQPGQRNSHFARALPILIALATLLLLGFSVYLASELRFIDLPFINNGSGPTVASTYGTVPNLLGLDYQHALAKTTAAGFKLQANNNVTTGVVVHQSPRAGDKASKGSYITVQMGTATPTPTITVPPHLVGNTLAAAEEILQNAKIPYKVQSAGSDPRQGPNIVTRVNPPEGSPLPSGQSVTLYVVNLTRTPTVTPSPTPKPTPTATPSPTPSPIPSPTSSPTPMPSPTPSPTPSLTPTPTPNPTPTPGASMLQDSTFSPNR